MNKKGVVIREAKKDDFESLKNIYETAGIDEYKTQYPNKTDEEIKRKVGSWSEGIFGNFKKEIESKTVYWILAEKNKEIVGFATVKIKGGEGWLNRNYVKKEYRNQGIGKGLIKKRLEWLKQNKIKLIYTKLFVNNKPSLKNLEGFGFKPVEIIMEKIIKL